MQVDVREEKLIVMSDLHIGHPFSTSKRRIIDFLAEVCDRDCNLVINGDGLDIMQTSFLRLAKDVPEIFVLFRRFARKGLRVYYVVGNHDIVLEHFLEDWGNFILVPFLNVSSGEQRIRIEHGHLYDPFFVGWPNLYEFMTRLVGIVLHAVPSLYSLWSRTDRKLRSRLQAKGTIRGEAPSFAEAAGTILERGFDTVIFGHTHCPGQLDVGGGQTYFNSGSWLMGSSYVQIEAGKVSLLSSPM